MTTNEQHTCNPIKAIGRALRLTFRFSGRDTRAEFWWPAFFWWALLPQVGCLVCEPIAWAEAFCPWLADAFVAAMVGLLALGTLASASRRLQDAGRSGKWLIPALVVGALYVAYIPLTDYVEPDSLLLALNTAVFILCAATALPLLLFLVRPSRGI